MKRCKHINDNGICLKGANSSGNCKLPCSHYESCAYHMEIPGVGLCCEAYYLSKLPNGKQSYYAHFPFCAEANCPIKHPELLKGRILDTERK